MEPNHVIKPLPSDMRVDLLESEDNKRKMNYYRWPVMNIKIQNVETKALIDTESKVKCITESFFESNRKKFEECKLLPIVRTDIVVSTGARTNKLKHQVYADFNLANRKGEPVFLIVPKLNKECIIGVNVLKSLKTEIDF